MPNLLPVDSSNNLSFQPKSRPRAEFLDELRSLGYQRIIGIDEVGRGALAGPIVVAAVEIYEPIDGVNDSKLLSRSARERLSCKISQAAKQVCFGQASNLEIDELGLAIAQRLAYDRCLENMSFDLVLTDNYWLKPITHIKAVKGDQLFYPVAAASIVAKVYRDQLMTTLAEQFPNYSWCKNAGYGTTQHKKALDSIGPSPFHRQSFID